MSQRASGWARKENEYYATPAWVTQAVVPHLPWIGGKIWEPAYGGGMMSQVLTQQGFEVIETDKQKGEDFFGFESAGEARAIVTNPPYNEATEFIEHALKLMQPCGGFVAMLLRVDFDSAKTRAHLFEDHPGWWKKVVLRRRIVWFEGEKSPSFNHSWYVWNWRHDGPATIAYAP